MSFVDVTGRVDADNDGIVFEGLPLERPIIPRFMVPQKFARQISSLTEGDSAEIEKQRRSGNSEIQFDENKLRSIVQNVGGDTDALQAVDEAGRDAGMASRTVRKPDAGGYPENRVVRDKPSGRILRGSRDTSKRGPIVDKKKRPRTETLSGGTRYGGSRRGRYGEDADIQEGINEVEEAISADVWDNYEVIKDKDGVYYVENLPSRIVSALRNGSLKPPVLPFFAPAFDRNNRWGDAGDGYFFSVTGRRFWGKFGASGALVRRKNKRGEFEYFLARRSPYMSVGADKWSFPGGSHKNFEDSEVPGLTAINEFKEEVGGDLSSLKPIASYKDQIVPDWAYDTYVFEVGPKDLNKLKPEDGENTETGWFTTAQIMEMADNDELLPSFARSIEEVLKISGDDSARRTGMRSGRENTLENAIRDDFDEDLTVDDLVKKYEMDKEEIKKILGISKPPKKEGMRSGRSLTWDNLILDDFDDGMTVDEIVEKYDMDKQEVIGIINAGSGVNDADKQKRQGLQSITSPSKPKNADAEAASSALSSLSDDELTSKLDDNVNALNELETLLDDGEIDLAEYRKRQVPLRKEAAQLGSEKKRRSGKTPQTGTGTTPRREKVMERGDGMIERDERGNPTKWDGKKFLDEQAENRRKWIMELGFTPEEADALLGAEPGSGRMGLLSTTNTATKPQFSLTPTNLFVKKVNSRKKGGSPEIAEWADREIANALELYDYKAPREWDSSRGSFIPKWFPSKESLIQELNHRGYDIYLSNGGSRRYNDLVHSLNARADATPEEMRRRIWKPSGLLPRLIDDKEGETGQVFPMKSKIKLWDFGSQIANMDDTELRAMDVEFDRERQNKLSDVSAGIISKEEFNNWYNGELTPLRRILSAELTHRQLRSAIDEKRTLDSVFGTGISPKEYAFLSKDPVLFTRAAGMLSRRNNGGANEIDRLIATGEITKDDLAFIERYHDVQDKLHNQLIGKLTELFGENPDDVDWDSLDISVKQQARQIHEEWMRKYSRALSSLGEDGDWTPQKLGVMGFDQGEIDDLMSNRSIGMSSNKKRKIVQKWTEEDKRAFSEQRLRSKKVPKKRKQGPSRNEWTERRAGREIKSNTRISSDNSNSGRMASYYESLVNQYFSGIAEYIGEDTRIVNSNYNENLPVLGEPFSTIRTSPVSALKEGDVLPDGFDSKEMWSAPANPRYKVVYVTKGQGETRVFGARDMQTGELVVKKMGINEILPNVMRQSPNQRYGGMASSRKVNDVKLQSRLTQQFRLEQFNEITNEFEGLVSELESIDAQIKILEKNMNKRRELGLSTDGFLETDDKRWTELEDMRSGIQDKIDEYVKFAEFVAEENLQRRRHKAAVATAKQRISEEFGKREQAGGRGVFDSPDSSVSEIFDFGATSDEIQEIIDGIDLSDQDMERVFTAGRPPFTGTKFAKQINDIANRSGSSIIGPEFNEFDKDDEDEQQLVGQIADKLIKSAALEVARNKNIADSSRTFIESSATDSPVAAAIRSGMTSTRTPMGKDLGVSRVVYPTKPNKFIAKDVAFVSYDANRQELSVGYKDKKKYVFGGITPNMVNDIENGDKTLIASLNAIKKDARYTINPDGSTLGSPTSTTQLLNRDKNRLNLSGDDLEIADSVINDLKNGQDDLTRKMRADRRNEAMGLASGLANNNEYAMAFNIMDALDEIDSRVKGSGYMPNGMRSYAHTTHQRCFVGMSQDEIGEVRDEIAAILKKYRNNFFINDGLSKYDKNLASAQSRSGRGQLVLMEPEYNAIMDAYEELAKIDPDWAFVVGPHPVEMAGVSKDGRFDTEKFKEAGDFAGKLINNGAPQDITVGEQKELINWARRQPGFRIVQSIASSYDEKNGTLTANQWRTLRSLQRNYGKGQYRVGLNSRRERRGMLSSSGDDMRAPDAVSANTMGGFIPYGAAEGDQRARRLDPNADLKGKSIQDAIPEGLSNEEQLALIEEIGQYSAKTNPDGIKGKDYVERRTSLLDSIASQRRLEERKAALERAKTSGQIGDDVNLPSHLEFWPLVSEDTKDKLNKASERKYGVQFIDLEPHQMEDVLVFETGSSGYFSGGAFKKIKKRPDSIEMEDWERLLLPIHNRVGELDAEEAARKEAQKLEQENSPSLEQLLEDPNITPERRARIERILAMKNESAARWQSSLDSAQTRRRKASVKDIKLDKYETIDEVASSGRKNVLELAKSKYDSDFDSLTDVQKRDVLDTYAREKFGIEHYRNIETGIQRARSRAERLYQQDRIDGENLAAWDEIAEVLEGSGAPTITRKKIDDLRRTFNNYPQENENSTDAEMSLLSNVDELSSLIDEIEIAYDDEEITIPTGRSSGMASRSSFEPSGVELKPEQFRNNESSDNEGSRRTGMSSIFTRRDKDSDTPKSSGEDAKPAAPVKKKPLVTDNWKKVGGQGGSNPGGFFEDENGVRYYVKTPPSLSHIESEVLAAELYKLLGIGVPEISAGTYKGRPNVISRLIDEPSRPVTGARGDGSKQWQQSVVEGFIADAWLANWDAILNDNVRMDNNGNPIRVDNGGSMKWRAQGGPKGAAWGDTVGELDSLRGQSPAAPVYRTVTPEQMKQQVAKLQSISPEQIQALVNSIISDPAEAKELSNRLIARRQDIINKVGRSGGMSSSTKPKPMPEFGSSKFMDSLPATIKGFSNEELMQMWDMTRPFVNLNQYQMSENSRNLNMRIEKIKTDIRGRIKDEVSLRLPSNPAQKEASGGNLDNGKAASELARQNRANSIQQAFSNRANSIKKFYSSTRMQEDEHTAVWDDLSDALNEDGNLDLTKPKIDNMIDILNEYISNDNKKISKTEQRTNVRQAEKMRDTLNQVSEMYADDPYIQNGADNTGSPAGRTVTRTSPDSPNSSSANQGSGRIGRTPTRATAQYVSARKNETRSQGMLSSTKPKEGRAEIRGEATFFKSVQDMLLHEAGKSDDAEVSSGLRMLKTIMDRQKSALISDKRTNAGAIYLTQAEIDTILDALFVAIDRQTERGGGDRAKLLADFADLIAKSAMSTFIDKSVPEVNSRTVKKFNSEGREVEIPLNE